ncbi:MAG: hypothetical protein QOF84_4602 [Streptomyces sp.]|nr:hypothetical protein [Streptomyces sp.]
MTPYARISAQLAVHDLDLDLIEEYPTPLEKVEAEESNRRFGEGEKGG